MTNASCKPRYLGDGGSRIKNLLAQRKDRVPWVGLYLPIMHYGIGLILNTARNKIQIKVK